jgi:membrane protein DedA with SNARE-associated domain
VFAEVLSAATALVDRLSTLDDGAVLLVTVLFSAVEMTFLLGLLVPGESVVMLAASLHGPAGFALAVGAGTVGGLAGQTLGYAVGRVFGARLRDTRLGRRIGPERFDRAEEYLRDRGAPALVAVRFVAVIHAVVPIVAGVARMPFGRFLGWSALGTLLWVGTFASVGAATASADSTGGIGLLLTAVGATCLGVVPFAIRLFRRPAKTGAATQPLLETTTAPRRAAGASRRTVRPGGVTRPPLPHTRLPLHHTRPAGAPRPLRWTALLTGPARPLQPAATRTGPPRRQRRTARPGDEIRPVAQPAEPRGAGRPPRPSTAPTQLATAPTRLLWPATAPLSPARRLPRPAAESP